MIALETVVPTNRPPLMFIVTPLPIVPLETLPSALLPLLLLPFTRNVPLEKTSLKEYPPGAIVTLPPLYVPE